MIWLKRLGYFLGAIVGLIALAIAAVYVVTWRRMSARYEVVARPIPSRADSAGLARGQHLATSIGQCVGCHGDDLGGTLLAENLLFGRLVASNLTTGAGGVASRYDDAGMARAIRHAIRHDGTPLRVMPSEAFQYLSDEDVSALVAYIRSVPPVDRELPSIRIGPLGRVLSLVTDFPMLPARVVDHDRVPPVAVSEDETAAYGEYLANVGGCTGCHGPGLSGGSMGPDKPASNLTPAGIAGTWSEADFMRALREGKRPVGADIDSLSMPWPLAGKMTDAEIRAVWAYLKSVPARAFGNR